MKARRDRTEKANKGKAKGKGGRYARQQEAYFKKKNLGKAGGFIDLNEYTTQIVAPSYIIFNPKFDVNVVYGLLGVHNKAKASVIIRGEEKDFENNPNEVYRIVNERKVLNIQKPTCNNGHDVRKSKDRGEEGEK